MTRLSDAELRRDAQALFTPARSPVYPGLVGAEMELILARGDGAAPRVLPLQAGDAEDDLVDFLAAYGGRTERIATDWDEYGVPRFRTLRQGRIGFEPGGQLEFSTDPRSRAGEAAHDIEQVLGPLLEAASAAGLVAAHRGLNPWHGADEVGLQLTGARYRAMDSYFRRAAPAGVQMMRLTASLQVNLDFGEPGRARRRWMVANLLGPVLTAAFANSPARLEDGTLARSARALIWRRSDRGRTRPVPGACGLDPAPWDRYLDYALDAPVMMELDERGILRDTGRSITFREWLEGKQPRAPTAEEWRIHLTTLFPDARPRGWIEIRGIDAPRPEWWSVPLTLLPALLYDDEALAETMALLAACRGRLEELSERAGTEALADGELCELADGAFELADRAAARFPEGYFDPVHLEALRAFHGRYVSAGRTQADEVESEVRVPGLSAAFDLSARPAAAWGDGAGTG